MKGFQISASYTGLLGAGLAFAGAVMFSAKAVFVKLAYQSGIDPLSLLMMRMLISLPFFLGIALYSRKRKGATRLKTPELVQLIAVGMLGYYLASWLDFVGLQYITASLERLVLFVYPTMVVVLASLVFRRPIRREYYLALLITYLGIALAFADKLDWGSQKALWIGALWVFGAAFAYACFLIGSEKLIPKVGAVRFTANALTASCAGVILHQLIAIQGLGLEGWPTQVYVLAACIALFSTVIPSFLFSKSIGFIGASKAAIIGSVGPVSTILLAWHFLNEHISLFQILGTALVLVGVGIISLSAKKG
ncbi:MAG: DMT family transporter [Bacteroidetes bacterium]|nr:MAG: DMT family transporter [Bacteroidota bacterium]